MKGIKRTNRNINIDLIKALAVFFVVAVHFLWNAGFYTIPVKGIQMYVLVTLRSLFVICVPLFLLITGFLMNKKELKRSYYKPLLKFYIVYLLCSICCLCFKRYYLGEYFNMGGAVLRILNFGACDYGWYVELYLILFLLIPFINLIWNNLKSKKQRKTLILTLIVLTILPTVLNSFDWYTKDFFLKPWSSNTYQKLIPDMWSVIYPLTYYFIGAYLGEYKIKLGTKKNFVLLVVSVFIFGLYNYFRNYGRGFLMNVTNNYNSVDNLITSVLFFVLILNLKIDKMPTIVNKSISSIARLSLSTYLLSNILDLFVYPKLIEMTDSFSERLIYYFPVVLFVFVLSNVFSYCVDYIAKLVVCFIDFLKSKLCRPEMNPKEN